MKNECPVPKGILVIVIDDFKIGNTNCGRIFKEQAGEFTRS